MSDVLTTAIQVKGKIQKTKKFYRILKLLLGPGAPIIAICAALAGLILLAILLVFLPFLPFGNTDSFLSDSTSSPSITSPAQYDVDGSTYFWPVPTISKITSPFGNRNLGGVEFHKGIDIANGAAKTERAPVYAMADGFVIKAGPASGYGQAIYIDHGNGLVTKYGHLDANMNVKAGDQVKKGQQIGRIGAGKVGRSTGSHLHFQVEVNGSPVDPLKYIQVGGDVRTSDGTVDFSYRKLNIPLVKKYLEKRSSALAQEDILEMIDRAGKETNVDPYLLIAITGQEQSFVPKNNNHADQIVKNPWNVFGCWCSGKGATLSTEQAAKVAAKTIVKLSKGRPENRNPIEWLSAKDNPSGYYASHNGWWTGVSKIYKSLLSLGEG